MKRLWFGVVLLGLAALVACGPYLKITRLAPTSFTPTTTCEVFTTGF